MSRRREVCQEGEKFFKKKISLSRRREVCQEEEKFGKKKRSFSKRRKILQEEDKFVKKNSSCIFPRGLPAPGSGVHFQRLLQS